MSSKSVVAHPSHGIYSPSATAHDEIIFVSGQLGCQTLTPENNTFANQVRASLNNLLEVLKQSNSSLALATMITIYLEDIADYAEFNVIYTEYLVATGASAAPPCRACFAVTALPLGGRVEIECCAVKEGIRREILVEGVLGLFSGCVSGGTNQLCWVAGQLSLDEAMNVVGDNAAEQTAGCMAAVKDVLRRYADIYMLLVININIILFISAPF